MTSGRMLARNTLWNLLGGGIPLLVAIFTIPLLIRGLGTHRFGVLTLAWMGVGYFSLFDLGLGRALTLLVSEKLGAGQNGEIPSLVWTALLLIAFLGVVGAAVLMGLSSWLVRGILKVPLGLQSETLNAFYLLALSVPIIVSTAGMRGVLEAYQRFDFTNIVRIPLGLLNFLGPLAVLPFSISLFPVVALLVAGRLVAWVLHLWLCLRVVPALCHGIKLKRELVRPLITFGSWMTVSNIISPLMVYFDRFLIGALLSMAAVAYYATPYEVVTRLSIISVGLVGVLFPAFSSTLGQSRDRAAQLFGRGINYVFLALFPLVLIVVTLSQEGLELWLGADFAKHSEPVLQWLAVGVLVNSLARVPSALVQGSGRPDITAKLHLIELPLYLATLWWLINAYGIGGAAVAWAMRVVVDAVALFAVTRWLLPATAKTICRIAVTLGAALLCLGLGTLTAGIIVKGLFLTGVMIVFVPVAWFFILSADERVFVCNHFKVIYLLERK